MLLIKKIKGTNSKRVTYMMGVNVAENVPPFESRRIEVFSCWYLKIFTVTISKDYTNKPSKFISRNQR